MKLIARQEIRLFLLLAGIGLLSLSSSSLITYFIAQNPDWFSNPTITFYLIFYLCSTFTMALALTPTTVIAILSGYLFGWSGILGVVISYLFASYFGLRIGTLLNDKLIGGFLSENPRFKGYISNLQENHLEAVFYGRISPIFPFAIMNMVFAAIRIRIRDFLLGSLVGMLPRTLAALYVGTQTSEILTFLKDPGFEGALALLPMVLIVISALGIIRLVVKSAKSAAE